jgi:hypothetical protein
VRRPPPSIAMVLLPPPSRSNGSAIKSFAEAA